MITGLAVCAGILCGLCSGFIVANRKKNAQNFEIIKILDERRYRHPAIVVDKLLKYLNEFADMR